MWWLFGILGVLALVLVFVVVRLSGSGMFDDTWRWCPTEPGTSSQCSMTKEICAIRGDENCTRFDKVWCPNSSPVCYRELAECEEHEDALCHER